MGIEKPQAVHRAGLLKQANKLHKHGRHRSKGSIDLATKGRVSLKSLTRKQKKELNKEARRHKSEQIRRNKRDDILAKKRGLGGANNAPFLVCVIPLHQQMDPESALAILKTCDPEAIVSKSDTGVVHIIVSRFKQRFSFVIPPKDNELEILDTLKVCDSAVLLISAVAGVEFGAETIDDWGNRILSAAVAQALPTVSVAVMDLESVHPKKRNETKQNIQKLITKWLSEEKLITLDKDVDGLNLLRKIGGQKQKSIVYRDRRPHVYAESFEYINPSNETVGNLKISGYLRGSGLSVNGLIHILGLGDFQMTRIEADNLVYSFGSKNKDNDLNENLKSIMHYDKYADPKHQEQLISENEIDEMEGEQTWPNEEDYKQAEEDRKAKKLIKKVPKGWSDYQAVWIPDVDAESVSGDDDEDEDEDEDMNFSDAKSESSSEEDEDDFKTVVTESEIGVNDEKYDQEMDIQAEIQDLAKIKAAKSDAMFPDEIDTPQNIPARVRFQKYRGLESFRTSPWDPKENLPLDYAKIFQFENFDRTKKRILKDHEEMLECAMPGWYVTIYVKDVPQHLWETYCKSNVSKSLIVYGVLPHEHKMSVLNVLLKRTSNYDLPIKSKERLIFQCGYRRFVVNPIFSEHTNGNKHKYFRYFQPNTTAVATFFGRIQFPPSPVLCFKEINNQLTLVATGNLLSVNPDRMVIKRIVLSGHLLKVHKRSAVVRFMFFNREDIKYFQPCKLRTKYGRIGHIKEPLGTHGHMKCSFNGQLKSQDTVLLHLYKRVYPKWSFEDCIVSLDDDIDNSMEQD